MNGAVLENLPPLRRESFSYTSPSHFRLQDDKERKGVAMKDCQEDIFTLAEPVKRRHNSATFRRKTYSEQKQSLFLGRKTCSERGTIFSLKPGYHRMAFNRSNCQADSDYFIQKDEKSLDCLEEHCVNGKQPTNRRQGKHDRSKLEHFDTDSSDPSQESSSKSLSGYQTSHKGQRGLYENEMWMTNEIHKKEILLQKKLLKVVETMKKVQLRTASEDKVKSEEQRNTVKAENGLYYTEKGNWDRESTRDRALSSRRHEGQQEGFNNWVKGKDGIERQEYHLNETNAGQKEKRREGIEWENRQRNSQRTTKPLGKEWNHFEEMTRHTRERARPEKDQTRRERTLEWKGNEMREQDQRDWQEIMRVHDGEKRRREQAKLKRDTEMCNEDQQWDLMENFSSNSHQGKAVSKHDKTNGYKEDHLATQERVAQYSNRATEQMLLKKPLHEADPSTHNRRKFQQMQVRPESTKVQLRPCKICNRHFTQDRLEKHFSICQKTQTKKRQVFDSSKHRVEGTALEAFLKTNGRSRSPEPKKNNWHQKHKTFIQNIRQARAPGGFQPSADLNSDYVTCPYCGRRFAPDPAQRHIPKCQNIKSKPPPPRQHR